MGCVGLLEHSPGMWEVANTGTRTRTSPIQPNAYLFFKLEWFLLVFEKQLWQVLIFFVPSRGQWLIVWLTQKLSSLTHACWGISAQVSSPVGSCGSGSEGFPRLCKSPKPHWGHLISFTLLAPFWAYLDTLGCPKWFWWRVFVRERAAMEDVWWCRPSVAFWRMFSQN